MDKDNNKKEPFFSLSLRKHSNGDPSGLTGFRRIYVRGVRVVDRVVRDFLDDGCLVRASALSFTTILSIVPFFALTFAVMKGLGVHETLEPYLIKRLTAGSQEIAEKVIRYIDNTSMGSVGAVGLVGLIVTVVTLIGNIEEAFNDIWGVRETRTLVRKFGDYLSVVVSAPILILAATSMTTSLQSRSLVVWLIETQYVGDLILFLFNLVPYFIIWIAFVFLYIFVPNTKVNFKSALVGGLLAGIIWQIAQWGYIYFQVGVSRYNAIYGTLSALPVFMVWVYTSWVIILFGVEVVCAHQNRKTFMQDNHHHVINFATRELTALALLLAVAESYYRDGKPWTVERFVEATGVPLRVLNDIIEQLLDLNYLAATGGEDPHYIPARSPEMMYLHEIIDDLKNYGESCEIRDLDEIRDVLGKVLSAGMPGRVDDTTAVSVKDLVLELRNEKQRSRMPGKEA